MACLSLSSSSACSSSNSNSPCTSASLASSHTGCTSSSVASSHSDSNPSSLAPTPPLTGDCSHSWKDYFTTRAPGYIRESKQNRKHLQTILDKCEDGRVIEWLQPEDYGLTPAQPVASLFQRQNIKHYDYTTRIKNIATCTSICDELNGLISKPTYQRMEPALRLATRWLIASEPFYLRALFADLCYDPVAEEVHWLDPNYNVNNYDRKSYLDLLPFLLERTTFHMGPTTNQREHKGKCCSHGTTGLHFINGTFIITVQLSEAYLEFFSRPDYDRLDTKLRRRVEFLFASTIGHEMAHVMYNLRRIIEQPVRVPLQSEPLYNIDDPGRELGRAWEQWMFGGLLGTLGLGKEDAGRADCLMKVTDILRIDWKDFARYGGDDLWFAEKVPNNVLDNLFDMKV